jgi:hypothetical protein
MNAAFGNIPAILAEAKAQGMSGPDSGTIGGNLDFMQQMRKAPSSKNDQTKTLIIVGAVILLFMYG